MSGRNLVGTIRPHNLIKISTNYLPSTQYTFVPTLLLSNVMSLVPKIDELCTCGHP